MEKYLETDMQTAGSFYNQKERYIIFKHWADQDANIGENPETTIFKHKLDFPPEAYAFENDLITAGFPVCIDWSGSLDGECTQCYGDLGIWEG